MFRDRQVPHGRHRYIFWIIISQSLLNPKVGYQKKGSRKLGREKSLFVCLFVCFWNPSFITWAVTYSAHSFSKVQNTRVWKERGQWVIPVILSSINNMYFKKCKNHLGGKSNILSPSNKMLSSYLRLKSYLSTPVTSKRNKNQMTQSIKE